MRARAAVPRGTADGSGEAAPGPAAPGAGARCQSGAPCAMILP